MTGPPEPPDEEHHDHGPGGPDAVPHAEVATDADRDAARQEQLLDYAHRLGPDARLASLGDDELEACVRSGASALAAATCQWLTLLAELVVRGVWAVDGARTPAAWLSWAVGQAPSTAREHVRVALRLRDCPLVRERFAAGTISYSKVRAITRICDPSTEQMLLRWADAAPAAALERICADARRLQRAAAAPEDRDDLGLTRRWRDDGALEVVLVLDPASGVAFEQRLDRLSELDDGTGDARTAPPAPDRSGGTGATSQGAGPPAGASGSEPVGDPDHPGAPTTTTSGRLPRRRRMADLVLGALAAAVDRAPSDASGEDRHLVVLHAPAEALAATADGPVLVQDGRGRTRLLPFGALAESACSATLGGVLDPPLRSGATEPDAPQDEPGAGSDQHGEGPSDDVEAIDDPDASDPADDADDADATGTSAQPVPPRSLAHPADLGRRRRQPSMPLRRALRMRDRSCRFPGCHATLFLHAHHVVFWSRGGRTDVANLVLLCGYHHHVVHDGGWLLRPDGPGRWTFHRTEDAPAARWSEPLTGDSAGELQAVLAADRHLADPRALLPGDWDGDRHDHDLVMQVLATALGLAA